MKSAATPPDLTPEQVKVLTEDIPKRLAEDSAACTCGAPKGRAHTKDCALHEHARDEFARALSAATTEGGPMLAKLIPVRWWTRKCKGNCGDTSGPHDGHLTWFGRKALHVRD